MSTIKEGYVPFRGYQAYYRIVGKNDLGKLPLLVLNGGPGMPHDCATPSSPSSTTRPLRTSSSAASHE